MFSVFSLHANANLANLSIVLSLEYVFSKTTDKVRVCAWERGKLQGDLATVRTSGKILRYASE